MENLPNVLIIALLALLLFRLWFPNRQVPPIVIVTELPRPEPRSGCLAHILLLGLLFVALHLLVQAYAA